MTEQEIDELVRQIGDQLLARLEPTPLPAEPDPPAGWTPPPDGLPQRLELTALDPGHTGVEVGRLCEEAAALRAHGVWVQPSQIAAAVRRLRGTGVRVGSAAGFPHGASLSGVKAVETEAALRLGAQAVQVVVNLGAIRSNDWDAVYADVRGAAQVAAAAGAALTAVIETPVVAPQQAVGALVAARLAGASSVATATGFGAHHAPTGEDVERLVRAAGEDLAVIAGDVRSFGAAARALAAGARRVWTNQAAAILTAAGTS